MIRSHELFDEEAQTYGWEAAMIVTIACMYRFPQMAVGAAVVIAAE